MKTRDEVLSFTTDRPQLPGEIARKIGKKTAAVSRCLSSLEYDGLVAGSLVLAAQDFGAGTERYSRAYRLTPEGHQRIEQIDRTNR